MNETVPLKAASETSMFEKTLKTESEAGHVSSRLEEKTLGSEHDGR